MSENTSKTPKENLEDNENKTKPTLKSTMPNLLKNKWINNGLWIVVFLVAYLLLRPYMQGDVVQGQAPNIQAESISGKPINLKEIKQPTLVHLWATWCPICKMTSQGVEALAENHSVISIATQSGGDDLLLEYAKQHGLNPDHIINDESGDIMRAYGAKAVPADFIVDSQGNISFVEVGYTSGWGLGIRLWLTK